MPPEMSAPSELAALPDWVLLHVPHHSVEIPPEIREQFVLDDEELAQELIRMTDHHTLDLFGHGVESSRLVVAPVSRLVVDVERFPDDQAEPMTARGMGAIYRRTSRLTRLRRDLSLTEQQDLMATYYWPHHRQLEAVVAQVLEAHGRALVIDCHSFPGTALPYESRDRQNERPDVCIGTDPVHTPGWLSEAFLEAFTAEGWTAWLNDPFAGAIVPGSHFGRDARVMGVMVEVNRRLYVDETTGHRLDDFDRTAFRVRRALAAAVESELAAFSPP